MDPENLEENLASSLSRRSLLKRIGAGVAIAWTAPVLTSLRTPAFAAVGSGPCAKCATAAGPFCPAFSAQPQCNASASCSCLLTQAGDCFCHQFISCGDTRVASCANDAACPPGWRCALSCCSTGFGDFKCHPPCSSLATAPKVTGPGTSGG